MRPAREVRLAHQPQYRLAFDVLGIAVPDEDLDPEFVEDESIQLGGAGFGRAGCGSRRARVVTPFRAVAGRSKTR